MKYALNMMILEEAVIEGLRVIALAIVPLLITFLESNTFDARLLYVTVAIALLRALDKYLHKLGSYTDNESLSKGLTRF